MLQIYTCLLLKHLTFLIGPSDTVASFQNSKIIGVSRSLNMWVKSVYDETCFDGFIWRNEMVHCYDTDKTEITHNFCHRRCQGKQTGRPIEKHFSMGKFC